MNKYIWEENNLIRHQSNERKHTFGFLVRKDANKIEWYEVVFSNENESTYFEKADKWLRDKIKQVGEPNEKFGI